MRFIGFEYGDMTDKNVEELIDTSEPAVEKIKLCTDSRMKEND